jgi:hypothetical protein
MRAVSVVFSKTSASFSASPVFSAISFVQAGGATGSVTVRVSCATTECVAIKAMMKIGAKIPEIRLIASLFCNLLKQSEL